MFLSEEEYDKLIQNFESFVDINEVNMKSKLLKIPSMLSTFINVHSKESEELRIMEIERKRIFGEKAHHYRYKSPFEYKGKEVEYQVQANKEYVNHVNLMEKQATIVERLENCIKTIRDSSFIIKTALDIQKFKSGES